MSQCRADWLGGGEMAKVIKAIDWAATPLGPIERWPQSLRTVVSLVQASSSPISLAWGPGHTQIYNDGYWPICGAKHPRSMGQDFRECWASAMPVIGEAYASAWAGRGAYLEKMRMFLDRNGFLEEAWFTFSFSPIADESGGVGGLFHPVTELTGQMLSERRTRTLRDLALRAASAQTAAQALALSAEVLDDANLDVSFAIFYELDEDATQARRVAQSCISARAAGPDLVDLAQRKTPWSIAEAVHRRRPIGIDTTPLIYEAVGPYPEAPSRAMVLPIWQPGRHAPAAVLVAGVSPRVALTEAYYVFFELVAGAVSTSLANARMLEDERHKAVQLAEIDRAKTTFFSNVSHEFRTPLTLLLGPLEEELAERDQPLPTARRARLETVHHNGLRLLKLVNTLLDFSRSEAGRLDAIYEPIDLAAETAQLTGMFRAAIERAGLTLVVDCPPLPTEIHVDRAMWEKIVLNLLSNAFKHTERGAIWVAVRARGDRVWLQVSDTGIGIAAEELPRLFERFHRVTGAWSRSHEGTGIGLALVRELARVLGGDVYVESTEGVGTTFTVEIRSGVAHLPGDRLRASGLIPIAASLATSFVNEAEQWVPTPEDVPAMGGTRPRVVWADDNADMRDYVTRLLSAEFDVVAVGDGAQALTAIRARVPELVLSDVMMPNVDGFRLLAAIRADARTHALPVILLSARAGEEASIEGINAGADDYLIKPFSARELLARVRTHIALAGTRRAWAAQLERANEELEAFGYSVSHDLRAPLRAIDGYSKMLLGDYGEQLAPQAREYLRRIHGGTRRMSAIIEDLLALSQLGRHELRRESLDLGQIAHAIVGDLRARSPQRIVDVEIDRDLIALGDARLMTLVLENLLANAWKFTSKRADAAIHIGREDRDVFYVHDNGVGFDSASSEKLFEPFQRLHPQAEFEGTGIGLAIVRRVIDRHGGRIWAESQVGEGATIRFTLQPPRRSTGVHRVPSADELRAQDEAERPSPRGAPPQPSAPA